MKQRTAKNKKFNKNAHYDKANDKQNYIVSKEKQVHNILKTKYKVIQGEEYYEFDKWNSIYNITKKVLGPQFKFIDFVIFKNKLDKIKKYIKQYLKTKRILYLVQTKKYSKFGKSESGMTTNLGRYEKDEILKVKLIIPKNIF